MILPSFDHKTAVKPKWKCLAFMNIGRFKNIDGECSKCVTIKKNSVFSNFCLYSKLLKTGMNRRISVELNPVDLTQVWTGKEKILYLVFIFTSSKQRRKKKNFTSWSCMAKKCTKKRATLCKICRLTFKTFCFLTRFTFSLLSPSSATQFYRRV